jgi:two-component system, NarL family, response regulator NreC
MNPIRVMLVEDHEVIRKGIAGLIQKMDDMEVVGEAGDGEAAIRMAGTLKPDVVIMDVMMPGLNGIEATRAIHGAFPQIKIVTLSLHSDREYVIGMLKAGALGYLLKDCAFEELVGAVRKVNARKLFLSRSLFITMAGELLYYAANATSRKTDLFTNSERDVLHQLTRGKSPMEIAAVLSLNAPDVEQDCQNIVNKWLMLFQ